MKKVEAILLVLVALCAGPALAGEGSWQQVATTNTSPATIEWQPLADAAGYVLTVSAPDGTVARREFKVRETPSFSVFDERGQIRVDGVYKYELRAVPRIDKATRQQLRAAREAGDEAAVVSELQKAGRIPAGALVQSGTFAVAGGSFVTGEVAEPRSGGERQSKAVADPGQFGSKVQVIAQDLVVQGSACVGIDCTSTESFGFDTIRLKENNLRIKFEDTSVGTFPSTDWQLTANDSASGGQNRFSIEDITSARVPFTVEGGSTTNSVYIDSTGRVGFRTSTPVLDIHINTSNTPAVRLEQNNSGGFTAQTWDVAGNEAGFFVRDVTSGSRLPFRIIPGAASESLRIHSNSNIGIGTASPSAKVHVASSGSGTTDGKVLVENTSGTSTQREMMELNNNGGVSMIFKDSSTTPRWVIGTNGNNFIWNDQGNAGVEMTLSNTGNLTITGVYSPSDINLKEDIVPVGRDVLAKLAAVPISTWKFKDDDIAHMGPMAQDFAAAFGLGIDNKHVSPMDMAGVSMAAVRALNEVVAEKDAAIAQLQQQNTELADRLAVIEEMLKAQKN